LATELLYVKPAPSIVIVFVEDAPEIDLNATLFVTFSLPFTVALTAPLTPFVFKAVTNEANEV
jgi:hypothetical protein